jgi:carboxymethylenebutenolidase
LQALWEEHLRHEFGTHNVEDALATMVEDAYVNDIPVMTGGVGKPALREFYSKYGIPQIPPDMELIPISRTIGIDRLVDEMLVKFTHTIQMDWMLPGIAPTGKRVEVAVINFTFELNRLWLTQLATAVIQLHSLKIKLILLQSFLP